MESGNEAFPSMPKMVHPPMIRKEDEVLLHCARIGLGEEAAHEVREAFKDRMDHNYLAWQAHRNEVGPLLYKNLSRLQVKGADTLMNQLHQMYYRSLVRNMAMYNELKKILGEFGNYGIAVIVQKGAVLAEILYEDIALRVMHDVDLMIKEKDFPKARDILLGLGYETLPGASRMTGEDALQYSHYIGHIIFFKKKNGISLELHFRLINIGVPGAQDEALWDRAFPVEICGHNTLMPSLEDFLLHLCAHANQHDFGIVKVFSDISEFTNRFGGEIDWNLFVNRAKEGRFSISVYYSLLFTHRLLGTPIRAEVLVALKPGFLRRKRFEATWGKKRVLEMKKDPKNMTSLYPLEFGTMRSRLLYLLRLFLPPLRCLALRFPGEKKSLLYVKYHTSKISRLYQSLKQRKGT
jgi:hypothetical protein